LIALNKFPPPKNWENKKTLYFGTPKKNTKGGGAPPEKNCWGFFFKKLAVYFKHESRLYDVVS